MWYLCLSWEWACCIQALTSAAVANQYDMGVYGPPAQFFTDLGNVDIRAYTVGLGFIGSGTYTAEYDQLLVEVNSPFGEAP